MEKQQKSCILILVFVILLHVACLSFSLGLQHRISWSIQPNKDFYTNWSSNHFFKIGDTLEFYNVLQVSRRDYDVCNGENTLQDFLNGPAVIPLNREGVYYFICNFSNYCLFGLKISITVHRHFSVTPPFLQPVPLSPASVQSPAPVSSGSLCPPAPVAVDSTQPPANINAPSNESGKSSSGSVVASSGWSWILCLMVFLVNY
ncbi:early nodulin-like protein [Thalictrum thalictroides]|uniref:Early nodulin-like protein n=1 Tax=Thalictrum thalictroides TaxID=46969 RepID=A0A7J6V1Y0_THATH|nr:early nodulin-like protein [Thalictrum thalictroides]